MSKVLGKLSKRYAKALFASVEQELGSSGTPRPVVSVSEKLQILANLWSSNAEFSKAILNPMFSSEDRKNALISVAQQIQCPDVLIRFLKVLIDRDRISGLVDIADVFQNEVNLSSKIIEVKVKTARALSQAEQALHEKNISEKLKATVKCLWLEDASLIGGMEISYGDKVIDGSIKGRLDRITTSLLSA